MHFHEHPGKRLEVGTPPADHQKHYVFGNVHFDPSKTRHFCNRKFEKHDKTRGFGFANAAKPRPQRLQTVFSASCPHIAVPCLPGFGRCPKTIDSSMTKRRIRARLGSDWGDPHQEGLRRGHDGATKGPRRGHEGATKGPRRATKGPPRKH